MKNISGQKGFTLIETIIYIGLFAFIMASSIVSVYSLLESASRNQAKAMVQEEGSYLVGKMDWVLASTKTVAVGVDGLTMVATRFDGLVITVAVPALGGNITLQRGANPTQDLNNSNVSITCPLGGCFIHTIATGDGINPESVEVNFTVNTLTRDGLSFSQDFSTIKYLRK